MDRAGMVWSTNGAAKGRYTTWKRATQTVTAVRRALQCQVLVSHNPSMKTLALVTYLRVVEGEGVLYMTTRW